MTSYQRSQRVRESVLRGLSRCRHSDAPNDTLSRFIDELRADDSWLEIDLSIVESGIRQMLAGMLRPAPA